MGGTEIKDLTPLPSPLFLSLSVSLFVFFVFFCLSERGAHIERKDEKMERAESSKLGQRARQDIYMSQTVWKKDGVGKVGKKRLCWGGGERLRGRRGGI